MTGDLPIPAPNIKNPELSVSRSGPGIYSAHLNIVFQDGASTRFADAPAIVFANSGREARESSTPPASRRWRTHRGNGLRRPGNPQAPGPRRDVNCLGWQVKGWTSYPLGGSAGGTFPFGIAGRTLLPATTAPEGAGNKRNCSSCCRTHQSEHCQNLPSRIGDFPFYLPVGNHRPDRRKERQNDSTGGTGGAEVSGNRR